MFWGAGATKVRYQGEINWIIILTFHICILMRGFLGLGSSGVHQIIFSSILLLLFDLRFYFDLRATRIDTLAVTYFVYKQSSYNRNMCSQCEAHLL